jgi:hypothetical protein
VGPENFSEPWLKEHSDKVSSLLNSYNLIPKPNTAVSLMFKEINSLNSLNGDQTSTHTHRYRELPHTGAGVNTSENDMHTINDVTEATVRSAVAVNDVAATVTAAAAVATSTSNNTITSTLAIATCTASLSSISTSQRGELAIQQFTEPALQPTRRKRNTSARLKEKTDEAHGPSTESNTRSSKRTKVHETSSKGSTHSVPRDSTTRGARLTKTQDDN